MRVLSEEEIKRIILNTVLGMGEVTPDEIKEVVAWCIDQEAGNKQVQQLIDGQILVESIDDGKVRFKATN